MEGVLITDLSCRPILSTHFASRLVASTCLDTLAAEVMMAREAAVDVSPIIRLTALPAAPRQPHVSASDEGSSDDSGSDEEDRTGYVDVDETAISPKTPSNTLKHQMVCCHLANGGLRYAVPVSISVDPILVFAFLEALVHVLEDYFGTGQINEGTVKDNFDTVLLVLEEMLGTSTNPMLSEVATLRELVTPPSLVAKLLSAATAALSPSAHTPAGQMPMTNNQALSSPLPWRKQGIRHKTNEIFFDIVEEIGGIVDRTGHFVTSEVWGKVRTKSKLSGMPDLTMTLSAASLLEDCSFHPCVRLSRWTTGKTLSFIPPEGDFVLMSYRLGSPIKSHPISALPLLLKPVVTIGEAGGSFHLTLTSRLPSARIVENVKIGFRLGSHATSVSASTSGGRVPVKVERNATPDESPPAGRWDFDARSQMLTWALSRLSSGDRPAVLSGTWQSSRPNARPASSILVAFEASLVNISGMHVEALKISGDTPPPYKGVRPMLHSGSLEFRW